MIKTAYQVSSKKQLLQQINFFSEETLKNSFIFEFGMNEFIQQEGNEMPFIFYILQGKAKILKIEENGKRLIIQFIERNDFIGELSLVKAEERGKDVVSLGQTICLGIPMSFAQSVLLNDVHFLQKISQYIGHKLLIRMEHFAANQSFDLKYRLAELMLAVSVDDLYKEKHTEISEYLGVSYRHLLHIFSQFKEWGFIEKKGQNYQIHRKNLEIFLREKQS